MDPLHGLEAAAELEGERFKEAYLWLKANMPENFFAEMPPDWIMQIVHSLMGFELEDFFSLLRMKHAAVVLHLSSPDADLKVLKRFRQFGIKHYHAFVSKTPPPIKGVTEKLRISAIFFTEAVETMKVTVSDERLAELKERIQERNPEITDEEFDKVISGINTRFLASLKMERLILALDMFFRARTRDHCQYEVHYNKDWEETGLPSMQIVLAWHNTPKYDMLYRLSKLVLRHGLVMTTVNATYLDPYTRKSVLIMALGLDGANGEPAWKATDLPDFLKELVTLKYFAGFPTIMETFVDSGLVRGNLGNLLKSILYFAHQVLVNVDPFLYTLETIEEGLCRHPDITVKILEAFELKFHPETHNFALHQERCDDVIALIQKLDTGHEVNDIRRKNVLTQALHFVQYTLKTNFYRNNKSAFSFRLDPHYLDVAPFNRKEKFPELPFSIFFIKGMHFIGFHVRFRNLSRGGLRTVFPTKYEEMLVELNNVFTECYNLAYTQQKKNKDIPEGGAKGVIFLKPYERLAIESRILEKELKRGGLLPEEIEHKINAYVRDQRVEYLLHTQRAYVSSLLTLVNCYADGTLKAKHIVDYYNQPEYIYLGPDERMSNTMINWIAQFAQRYGYRPGVSFISGKPNLGINHKEYGVTSLGVNVYMTEVLRYLGIHPERETFTVKISGGPDGDVAGNQILNLHRDYPETAKLLALTDVSGTIYDPNGLNLEELVELFHAQRPISYYPPQTLSDGGFLLDRSTQKEISAYAQQTLCWRKENGKIRQDWLSASEATRIFHTNVHQTPTDVFIPAGGRPRALHASNIDEFLDDAGNPTSKAIVEGANLYLTQDARRILEDKGVIIIRDSSANKCGVICSSYEVLSGLILTQQEFLDHKETLVKEILEILRKRAEEEARLMLETHRKTGAYLTDISEKVSKRINSFTDQILCHLEETDLTPELLKCVYGYVPPLLNAYQERTITELPETHSKAIIACQIAGRLVYSRGLDWFPSVVDILPVVLEDPDIVGEK